MHASPATLLLPWYRITIFREPSASFMKRYLDRQDAAQGQTNHQFAGFSDPKAKGGDGAAPPHPPPGFQERTVRRDIDSRGFLHRSL